MLKHNLMYWFTLYNTLLLVELGVIFYLSYRLEKLTGGNHDIKK